MELWKESGRYDDYGVEMLCIKDCGDRDFFYGLMNEELIIDIFCGSVKFYKDLFLNLYYI